ncbi:MAG: sigma-70 family RNA polymerase sigma factor [Bacteroidetes bacterium]|nr:sigma-70 family RNA polymerase sigma factor [Bacteroidota bacterium]MBS1540079.1 sigma-70 family RNA polymerase sigma factor [Bacteroidota bacterium]
MILQKTDSELLSDYKTSGRLEVIGELYKRYTSLVLGVCLKYLKDREEAKDAVMQVFEKLIADLRTHEVTHFRGWLYVATRNHCLMQLRSKKGKFKEDISALRVENQFLLHPEPETELEDNLEKLKKCIEKLADEQQQCVRLFYLEEKCYREIETITQFDFNQVKSFIQNGKRNLKSCMEKHG